MRKTATSSILERVNDVTGDALFAEGERNGPDQTKDAGKQKQNGECRKH